MIRKRYYHYPSPIAIDKFNTRVLTALSTKLSRDYLGFFGNLAKTYTQGPQKKKLDSITILVKKSIVLLNSMITNSLVSKKNVQDLVDYVEEINQSRDDFLQQAEQNKSLDAKIQKITNITGITPGDLNVTKEIVQKGASTVRKRTKEGIAPFLKRTMPGTLGLAGEAVGGTGTALLGPFAPLAAMAGTLAKGAFGVGKGVREKFQARKEDKLSRQLSPMSAGLPTSTFNRMERARAQHPFAANFGGLSQRSPVSPRRNKEDMVLPLTYFFDKKAHKTKWTKELLDRFKNMEKMLGKKEGGSLGGAILPLIGTIAAFGVGIVAATVSVYEIVKAARAFTDWWKSKKAMEESEKVGQAAAKNVSDFIIGTKDKPGMGIQQYSKKAGKRVMGQGAELLHGGLTKDRYRAKLRGEMQLKNKPAYGSWSGMGAPVSDKELDIEYQKRLTAKISQADVNRVDEKLPAGNRSVFPGLSTKKEKTTDTAVVKAIEKLNETISRQRDPGVRGAALGDPYGVGDPYIVPWSSGQLSVESE